jgi:zinc transport system permease protein
VVPVATAQQLTRTFKQTLLVAMALGTVAAVGGILISANVEVAPGATIVLLALAGFALAWPVGMVLRRRRRVAEPFSDVALDLELGDDHTVVPEEHGHEHGPDCGHQAVPHGDHVDYLHGGHRHAPHGGHYDEH